MPNGTNFSAKARAAELNAARARRAAQISSIRPSEGLTDVPEIAPLSLGALNFVKKRTRVRQVRDELAPSNLDRLQSENTMDGEDQCSSTSNISQPPQSERSSLTDSRHFPALNAASSHKDVNASSGLGPSQAPLPASDKLDTTSSLAAESEKQVILHEPHLPDSRNSSLPFPIHQDCETGMSRDLADHERSRRPRSSQQPAPFFPRSQTCTPVSAALTSRANYEVGGGVQSHSDNVGISPHYQHAQQFASPSHAQYGRFANQAPFNPQASAYCPPPSQPHAIYHSSAQGSDLGPSSALPSESVRYPGTGKQMPALGCANPTIGTYTKTQPSHISSSKMTSISSADDPFTDNLVKSTQRLSSGLYQPSSRSRTHPQSRISYPAVKGTYTDEIRSQRLQKANIDDKTASDHARLDYQALSRLRQSGDRCHQAEKPLAAQQNTDFTSESEAGSRLDSLRQGLDDMAIFSSQGHNRKPQHDRLREHGALLSHRNSPMGSTTMPDFDPDTLRMSDPLPPYNQNRKPFQTQHDNSAIDFSGQMGYLDQHPQLNLDSEASDPGTYRDYRTNELKTTIASSGRHIGPEIDIFSGKTPPKHREVRDILLRQSGLEPLPDKTYHANCQLFAGSEPLSTPVIRRPDHAPIGSERRKSSVSIGCFPDPLISDEERDQRAAVEIMAPVIANLHAYAAGMNRDHFSRFGQPPAWAIDHSAEGNKSLFGGEWGNPPQRVARDPRYLSQGTIHEGRLTYFEDLSKQGPSKRGTGSLGFVIPHGRGR